MAAPLTPISKRKINMGSKIILATAPMAMVIMPVRPESLAVDEIVHSQTNYGKKSAQKIDGKIVVGVGKRYVAGAENI